MNILFILLDHCFPPDIRVEKEARSLIASGYRVHLLTRRGKYQSEYEKLYGIHVHRFSNPAQRIPSKMLSRFIYYLVYRLYVTLVIIPRLIKNCNIDALHVHDLPFALAVSILGKLIGRPVIFDMHEHYPVLLSLDLIRYPKIIRPIARSSLVPLLVIEEKLSFRLATKIIVIVEEEENRLLKSGVSAGKISVIWNVPDLDQLNTIIKTKKNKFENKFVISYVGGFDRYRGLETLIMAMPLILKRIPNAYLLLVGSGHNEDSLRRLVKIWSLNKSVKFTGWVPFSHAMGYIKSSDVCVIPYCKTRFTNKSFPNKLGQYMYFSKPIITSDVDSFKRIVKEERCGLTFKVNDPKDLAKKVIKIYENPLLAKELGKNGQLAIIKKYNWYVASDRLLELYGELRNFYK